MIKVGLTGGIGSGKTTVSNFLLDYGIPVYNSDNQGKTLMNTNLELKNDIISLFGESVYDNGILKTNLLSSIVFKDPKKIEQLNNLVHPKVADNFNQWIGKNNNQPILVKVLLIPYWLTGTFWELENFNLSENLNQIFVIFCFLLTIKREIVKDMEDIQGDLKTGSYTLAIVAGQKFSKIILSILVLISIGFLIICVLESILNIQNIFFFLTMISLLVAFLYKTYLSFEKSDFKTLSNLLKINFLAAGIWLYILL